MSNPRSLDLASQIVALAQTAPGLSPADGSNCQRTYALTIGVDPNDPSTFVWGRQVLVFPMSQDGGQDDRQTLSEEYEFAIVVFEMWLATAAVFRNGVLQTAGTVGQGPVPDSWIDDRVSYVEALFDVLRPTRILAGSLGQYYRKAGDQPCKIVAIYDRDELLERKLFVSEIQVTFKGWTDLGGN